MLKHPNSKIAASSRSVSDASALSADTAWTAYLGCRTPAEALTDHHRRAAANHRGLSKILDTSAL